MATVDPHLNKHYYTRYFADCEWLTVRGVCWIGINELVSTVENVTPFDRVLSAVAKYRIVAKHHVAFHDLCVTDNITGKVYTVQQEQDSSASKPKADQMFRNQNFCLKNSNPVSNY